MNEDDSGLCQMFRVGIPELELIEFCKRFSDKEKQFIDGGAHMGVYSILLADYFKSVNSFEAQQRTFYQLCGNIFLNEKQNITAHNLALTATDEACEELTLYVVSDDGGGSSLLRPKKEKIKSTEKVQTIDIDAYGWRDVGFMKLDVEGAELDVLHGATQTIKASDYPPILFESNGPGAHNKERAALFNYLTIDLPYKISSIGGFDNMFLAVRQ